MRRSPRLAARSATALAVFAALVLPAILSPAASAQGTSFLVLFGSAPGLQQPIITQFTNVPVRAGGSLSLSFHGDPGTGCAAAGVCGMSGDVSWSPASQGDLSVFEARIGRRVSDQADLSFDNGFGFGPTGGNTNARVIWSAAGAGPAGSDQSSCADAQATGEYVPLTAHRGRLEISLAAASPSVVQTRCGGPLASDLGALLPHLGLPFSQAVRGRRILHLTGSGSFASHGFAGNFVSDITLRLGRTQRSHVVPSPGPGGHETTERQVVLEDTARLSGALTTDLKGAADPDVCGPLGACGLAGTEVLRPEVTTAADFSVAAPASRPKRDLLAALGLRRAGRTSGLLNGGFLGLADWSSGGTLTTALEENPLSCGDQEPLGPGTLEFVRKGRELEVAYGPAGSFGSAASLRSRCPGPFGPPSTLATAKVPLRDLARHSVSIRLTGRSSFGDDGYTATTMPDLVLTLTRKRLVTRTFKSVTAPGVTTVVSSRRGSTRPTAGRTARRNTASTGIPSSGPRRTR